MTHYQKAKAAAREKAVEFSNNMEEMTAGLSWGELAEIQNRFERLGRRYGLLREFRENAIC